MTTCAVIVACGAGKRMYPYSEKWHKAALPVCNTPLIERLTRQINAAGIQDIRVVADNRIEQLRYVLRHYSVTFYEIAQSTGTAQAVAAALQEDIGNVLVVYADLALDEPAIALLVHSKRTAILVTPATDAERPGFGVRLNEDNVSAIYGQPRSSYAEKIAVGAYYLDAQAVGYLYCNPGRMLSVPVGGMPPETAVIEQSIQTYIEDGYAALAVEAPKFAVDVNYPWDLLQANARCSVEILESIEDCDSLERIHPSAIIEGRVRLGNNSRIGRNVVIQGDVWIGDDTIIDYGAIVEGNCIIGSNCRIKNNCLICGDTVIGDNNKIDYCAQVGGMTLDNVCIVHHAEILGLIGSHVDIGAGTMMGSLRFDDGKSRKQAGDYANFSYIGDYTRCGVSNIFYPGVVVGSNCALGPGLIISSDIESNSLILVEQSTLKRYWGPEKYGW